MQIRLTCQFAPELKITTIQRFQNFHSGTVFKNLCFWCPKTDQNSVYAWTGGLTGFKNILIHVDRTLCPATRTRMFPNPQLFPSELKNLHV